MEKVTDLQPIIERLENISQGLDLLTEILSSLQIDDATLRTGILESIAEVYAHLNQIKARAGHKRKDLASGEAVAQFSAQFKLFNQSITSALGLCETPERCDEQLSRLLLQLEELESQFNDFDEFLNDIISKRDEIYEAFEARKQNLLEQRQRRSQNISSAAQRIIDGISRKTAKISEQDELNTYFSSDAMVLKCHQLVAQLRDIGDAVKADDMEAKLKSAKEQAIRSLRDKADIYEGGGNIIKLGKHKFSVNTQALDLTILPKDDQLMFHLTGTDYFAAVNNKSLDDASAYWQLSNVAETAQVYRAEYLTSLILNDAQQQQNDLSISRLVEAIRKNELDEIVRRYAAPRYKEGYEKGIHDHDATKILQALIPVYRNADLLRFSPKVRALAVIYWANNHDMADQQSWPDRARTSAHMEDFLKSQAAHSILAEEIHTLMDVYYRRQGMDVEQHILKQSADYLAFELAKKKIRFVTSQSSLSLVDSLTKQMKNKKVFRQYEEALQRITGQIFKCWRLSEEWLRAYVEHEGCHELAAYIPEAVAILNAEQRVERQTLNIDLNMQIDGLMGDHNRIEKQGLALQLDEFLTRLDHHHGVLVKEYHDYLLLKQSVLEENRKALRLHQFTARPLSSFVRNKLTNNVYLHLVGDNFAKQMGTVGDDKCTDLMGMLMMISPPGYGKTTLMEYIANRLGLIFMKINCPSIGHYVGEAQLLTTGAEENLLKLAELQDNLTSQQVQRWSDIKKDFLRIKSAGGDDADGSTRLANQIANITVGITDISASLKQDNELSKPLAHMAKTLASIEKSMDKFEEKTEDKPEVESSKADKKRNSNSKLFKQIGQISEALAGIDQSLKTGQNLEKLLAHIAKSLTVLEKNINTNTRSAAAKSTPVKNKTAEKSKRIINKTK